MKDHRFLISVSEDYVQSLGRAMYCFAILEWNVAWTCECLVARSLTKFRKLTAGKIAERFVSIVAVAGDHPHQHLLSCLAQSFTQLVEIRNAIAHGKPGSDLNGAQRIFRNGLPLTIDDFHKAADDFTVCSNQLNSFVRRS